ncbi:unnamed protein product [Amoebophrya sp. A25]|nr:unnamed protein product [Amoebophrya sp. A25]|eukprot:GSA25T00022369001.1
MAPFKIIDMTKSKNSAVEIPEAWHSGAQLNAGDRHQEALLDSETRGASTSLQLQHNRLDASGSGAASSSSREQQLTGREGASSSREERAPEAVNRGSSRGAGSSVASSSSAFLSSSGSFFQQRTRVKEQLPRPSRLLGKNDGAKKLGADHFTKAGSSDEERRPDLQVGKKL